MRFGCFVSVALWLGFVSFLTGSMVPIALGLVFFVGLVVYRGLDSERPLY